jgi:glyoxylase-like metal-dependent hydrolase (beta-lactamase superfamily II)
MEIVPGVHLIEGIIAHCYLIDGPELILIDTGMPRKTKQIIQYITENLHRNPSDLKNILLTHCDIDHIGNARELRSITGASIAAHPLDAEIIAGKKIRQTPNSGMNILFKLIGFFLRIKSFPVDKILHDGDTIAGLTVLHMPGHTPGSLALYDSRRKVLFIGDTLGYKEGAVRGPSRSVTWDMKQTLHSIEKLSTLDFSVMLSGHGEPLTLSASTKVQQFIAKMNENKMTW